MDPTELTLKVEGRKLLYERTKLALDPLIYRALGNSTMGNRTDPTEEIFD